MKTGESQPAPYAPEALLTPVELAQRLKVPETWVYEQTRARAVARSQEAIPVVPVGRYLRFYWPEVREWLQRKATERANSNTPSSNQPKRLIESLDIIHAYR